MKDEEFEILLKRSRQIEQKILEWYRKNIDPKTKLSNPKCKEYDLICPKVNNVEIKEDNLAYRTGNYVFEYQDQAEKPSGIAATTAGEYVLVDKEFVCFIKTISLLFLIKECTDRRIIQMGYTTKESKRAVGYLIPRNYIINSPYVKVIKRWFP
jgi:hypothetical protein